MRTRFFIDEPHGKAIAVTTRNQKERVEGVKMAAREEKQEGKRRGQERRNKKPCESNVKKFADGKR